MSHSRPHVAAVVAAQSYQSLWLKCDRQKHMLTVNYQTQVVQILKSQNERLQTKLLCSCCNAPWDPGKSAEMATSTGKHMTHDSYI